ncbi:ExbD/TolR family protein [Horticoccus sp. 23ND18S-11]|uniref:ExbD/TolR family protein n=1 Tax=Horticoccus sp. 23ND18S-11 TaxID=3391832 RepID=UPI0039C9D660
MSLAHRQRRKRPELNLVPLIDVLVMLIFFAFVTMQFKSASTLNITLPKVETAGKNEFRGNVTIAIAKDGALSFNGKDVTDAQLIEALKAVKNIDKDTPVLIRMDEKGTLDRLTFVWDACRKVGLTKHSLQSR